MQEKRLKILVVCTGNSARSQMAEGFFKDHKKEWEIYSAGTFPKGVNPLAIEVMKEKGIDISGHRSKNISLFTGNRFDYVITVCDNARELCPVFPGDTRYINWSFTDPATFNGPADKRLNTFRTVRDEIESKIIWFIEEQSVV